LNEKKSWEIQQEDAKIISLANSWIRTTTSITFNGKNHGDSTGRRRGHLIAIRGHSHESNRSKFLMLNLVFNKGKNRPNSKTKCIPERGKFPGKR